MFWEICELVVGDRIESLKTANVLAKRILSSSGIGLEAKRRRMGSTLEQAHEKIRQTCLKMPLVEAHAYNVVALDSNLPFLQCLSEKRGHEALSGVPRSLAYQVVSHPCLVLAILQKRVYSGVKE